MPRSIVQMFLDILRRKPMSGDSSIGKNTSDDEADINKATGALQYRSYELVNLQNWPRADSVYADFDQPIMNTMAALPSNPLPELSPDEYRKACEVYYQGRGELTIAGQPIDVTLGQIEKMIVQAWRFDASTWPGPDRAKWHIDHDVVSPSPDGRFACVLYSCDEIRLGWVVGLLALLDGPPDRPTVVLSPRNFTCYCGSRSIQWLGGGRYCVVIPYLFNQSANRIERLAFTFLDTVNQSFAEDEITDLGFVGQAITEAEGQWVIRSCADQRGRYQERVLDHHQLSWRPWGLLTGTSGSPDPRTLEGRHSIETPWGKCFQE